MQSMFTVERENGYTRELERIRKEVVVAYFKDVSYHSSEGSRETH